MTAKVLDHEVKIPIGSIQLEGTIGIPSNPKGMVVFAYGSGSSRLSPRNRFVAQVLRQAELGTLLFDLFTEKEDIDHEARFEIDLLADRLVGATRWLMRQPDTQRLAISYFGASTGAAAALQAAAEFGPAIGARSYRAVEGPIWRGLSCPASHLPPC